MRYVICNQFKNPIGFTFLLSVLVKLKIPITLPLVELWQLSYPKHWQFHSQINI